MSWLVKYLSSCKYDSRLQKDKTKRDISKQRKNRNMQHEEQRKMFWKKIEMDDLEFKTNSI